MLHPDLPCIRPHRHIAIGRLIHLPALHIPQHDILVAGHVVALPDPDVGLHILADRIRDALLRQMSRLKPARLGRHKILQSLVIVQDLPHRQKAPAAAKITLVPQMQPPKARHQIRHRPLDRRQPLRRRRIGGHGDRQRQVAPGIGIPQDELPRADHIIRRGLAFGKGLGVAHDRLRDTVTRAEPVAMGQAAALQIRPHDAVHRDAILLEHHGQRVVGCRLLRRIAGIGQQQSVRGAVAPSPAGGIGGRARIAQHPRPCRHAAGKGMGQRRAPVVGRVGKPQQRQPARGQGNEMRRIIGIGVAKAQPRIPRRTGGLGIARLLQQLRDQALAPLPRVKAQHPRSHQRMPPQPVEQQGLHLVRLDRIGRARRGVE